MNAEKAVKLKVKERLDEKAALQAQKERKKVEVKNRLVETVKAHGGPCCKVDDVERILEMCGSEKEKVNVLKDEMRYLKNVLGVKHDRLCMGKKGVDELKSDILTVLSTTTGSLVPPNVTDDSTMDTPDDSTMDTADGSTMDTHHTADDEIENMSKSQKRKERDEEPESSSSSCNKRFKFDRQGVWVAVAYEQDYFIGQVIDVKGDDATIQFLNRGYKDVFRCPRIDDIAEIAPEFVLTQELDVVSKNQGRTWIVNNLDEVLKLYNEYKKKFFD